MPILGRNKEVQESSVKLKLVAKLVVGSLLLQIVQATPYINRRRQIRSWRVYDRQRWLKRLFDSSVSMLYVLFSTSALDCHCMYFFTSSTKAAPLFGSNGMDCKHS
jgi:hypothetical protein